MTNPAAGEGSDYNTQIINEFRANGGRVGGALGGHTRPRPRGSFRCSADPPGLSRGNSRRFTAPRCLHQRQLATPLRRNRRGKDHH